MFTLGHVSVLKNGLLLGRERESTRESSPPSPSSSISHNPTEQVEKELWESEGSETWGKHNPPNQLNRAHGGSQKQKQHLQSPYQSVLNSLDIYYGY